MSEWSSVGNLDIFSALLKLALIGQLLLFPLDAEFYGGFFLFPDGKYTYIATLYTDILRNSVEKHECRPIQV